MFTKNSTTARSTIKKYLIAEGVKYECKICGQGPIWNDLPLILELDHVNGERTDNTKENLRLLCPQCHSQQKTSSRNKRIGVHKISDSAILESLKNSRSVREAIVKLGCLDSGPAYVRVRKIMRESGFVYTKAAQDVDTYWRTKPKPEMRKVVRPSKEVLEAEVKTTNFSALGRKYGVSDNAIRKWCKTYKII